jgi:glutaredoxin
MDGMGRMLGVLMVVGCVFACDKLEEGRPSFEALRPEPMKPPTFAQPKPTEKTKQDLRAAKELSAEESLAMLFKYTDSKGVVHYVDSLDQVPAKYRKTATVPKDGTLSIIPSTRVDDLVKKAGIKNVSGQPSTRKHDQIILYKTDYCGACKLAQRHLERADVKFYQKNVQIDQQALREMLEKSGGVQSVPIIDVYGTVLRGYNSEKLDRALKGS